MASCLQTSSSSSTSKSSSNRLSRFLELVTVLAALSTTTEAFQLTAAPTHHGSNPPLTRLDYASTAALSPPTSAPTPSLRDLLGNTKAEKKPVKKTASAEKSSKNHPLASFIRQVDTLEEYNELMKETTTNAQSSAQNAAPITVVRFHATYCTACKRATPAFHRLVRKHVTTSADDDSTTTTSNNNKVQFVDVAISKDNADLQKHVGLETIPYGYIYQAGSGVPVEGMSVNTRSLRKFEQTLDYYAKGECPVHYQTS